MAHAPRLHQAGHQFATPASGAEALPSAGCGVRELVRGPGVGRGGVTARAFYGRDPLVAAASSTCARQLARNREGVSVMNVNLEVVSIPVSDVDKALEFYHDRLG